MFKYNAETNKAIRDSFNKLKLGKQFENLYAAVLAGWEVDGYVDFSTTLV